MQKTGSKQKYREYLSFRINIPCMNSLYIFYWLHAFFEKVPFNMIVEITQIITMIITMFGRT